MPNPASQTLLKAFLKALYSDDYITVCEEEFGFVRVSGDLRTMALDAIDGLTVSDEAPEWTFETETEVRVGQGDYVISVKRDSYSEIEQDSSVADIKAMQQALADLQAQFETLQLQAESSSSHTHTDDAAASTHEGEDMETQLTTALALAGVSFALWMLTIIGVIVKFVLKV